MSSTQAVAQSSVDDTRVVNLSEANRKLTDTEQVEMTKKAKHHKKWNRRLKFFFCCLGYKKNKESIADVASIFAEFYSDLDVKSSDLAAGFVLLSKYQAAQRQWIVKNQEFGIEQYLSSVPIKADTNFLDISTAEDSHLINDLIYYMNYSLAIFGWPMQMVDDPCMLCCICPYLNVLNCSSNQKRRKKVSETVNADECSKGKGKKSSGTKDKSKKESADGQQLNQQQQQKLDVDSNDNNPDQENRDEEQSRVGQLNADCDMPIILEDNCCGCNVASVERRLRAHNYEIIYVSYKVNVNVVPFLVAADHSKQSIVVAMRGSMSLSDMVTDMNGQVDKLPIDDCPEDWLCHRGITRAASHIKSTLMQEHILARAFNCRPDLGSQDYNLILCGHSLGAGVAAILGVLLRKEYPTLRAYLYSPPGGILSLPVVEYTKQFATGIILGNDCVPRLGVAQLERLRYHILLSLKSSQKTPGKILAKALCPSCCFGGLNKVDYDPTQSLNLLYGTGGRSFDYNGSKIPFQVQSQVLYVPGRLIHIVKNHSFKSKARRFFNEPIYQAVWTENLVYDRIILSEGMFYDHLPNNLMHAMKMLFSKTLPARKDSKASTASNQQQPTIVIDNFCNNNNNNYDQQPIVDSSQRVENIVWESKQIEPVIKDADNNNSRIEIDVNNNLNNVIVVKDANNNNENLNIARTGAFAGDDKNLDNNGNDENVSNRNL